MSYKLRYVNLTEEQIEKIKQMRIPPMDEEETDWDAVFERMADPKRIEAFLDAFANEEVLRMVLGDDLFNDSKKTENNNDSAE